MTRQFLKGYQGLSVPREDTITSNSTWSINSDTTDLFTVTAQASGATPSATIANPTGTPVQGQRLVLRFKDVGFPRTLGWGTAWRAPGTFPLPAATIGGQTHYLEFVYNATDSKWDLVSSSVSNDGWLADVNTWKYTNSASFTIPGDATPYLAVGAKVSYNDGAVEYGVVQAVSHGGSSLEKTGIVSTIATSLFTKTAHGFTLFQPVTIGGLVNTTGVTNGAVYWPVGITANTFQLSNAINGAPITLGGTSDAAITTGDATFVTLYANAVYAIANATLTAPRYSYAGAPMGFPVGFLEAGGGNREVGIVSSGTPSPDSATTDIYSITAQGATAAFVNPAGNPVSGQQLVIRIKDDGTARALTWDTQYRNPVAGIGLPATTVVGDTAYLTFRYNATDTKWDLVGVTGKIGYTPGGGTGGTVTQITSRTTTVVLSKLSGTITLFTATLAADTDVTFTWTNTRIAAGDVVVFNVIGGAAVKGGYHVNAICGAGSATVTVRNVTPTITASEAPQLAFVVVKGATS